MDDTEVDQNQTRVFLVKAQVEPDETDQKHDGQSEEFTERFERFCLVYSLENRVKDRSEEERTEPIRDESADLDSC